MMRPLILVLLLLATPAVAAPLPLLDGSTYNYGFTAQFRSVSLATSEFSVFGNAPGDSSSTYQGVFYCQNDGHPCGMPGVYPQPIFVDFSSPSMSPAPPCSQGSFNACPSGTYPVQIRGRVGFFVVDHEVTFDYMGTGIGTYVADFGFTHADFGPSVIQNPEPSTWLLLGSGLVALAFARKKLAA